jgi:hypothetical protein
MTEKTSNNFLLTASLVLIFAIGAYYVLNAPDRRNAGEKMSDAINELPNGLDKAGRQLESRTPADKLGDAVKDAGNEIKKSTNQQ